jgi:hypothetical protein
MSAPEEGASSKVLGARHALWVIPALALFGALAWTAIAWIGSQLYSRPVWHRWVDQTRLNLDERHLALVVRSWLAMDPKGLAEFPDGGIPITIREVRDVWVCDPQQRVAHRVASIPRPGWIAGGFSVWMTDWRSHGERSSLYLRISGTKGSTSNTPRVTQHVRVDFDRRTTNHPSIVYLDSPRSAETPSQDFVNPGNEYAIMSVRSRGDTLLVWTDRNPDWRARFWVDRAGGNVQPLDPVPRRSSASAESALVRRSIYHNACPENIRGTPSATESRITFGGVPPAVTATITRVDASCSERLHPTVGDDNDGDIEFVIAATAWIDCKIEDAERFEKSGHCCGEEVIFEVLSSSSVVLASTSMGFTPYPGGESLSLGIEIRPEDVHRVARVVARWDRVRNTK